MTFLLFIYAVMGLGFATWRAKDDYDAGVEFFDLLLGFFVFFLMWPILLVVDLYLEHSEDEDY